MGNYKVLVTGGAGYIGSVMVPQLLSSGYSVTVFDNFMYKQNSLLDVCYHPSFSVVNGDVRDIEALKKEIINHDIIIPLAAIVGAPACDRDPSLATDVNLTQVENISKWVSASQMVLFPVTNSGYGIGQEGVYCDEKTPLRPISHYGQTKVAAEDVLLQMGNVVTFRLATVFGCSPRMRLDLLVNDFVYRAVNDRFIVLFESHFKRNYIHIRDVFSVFFHGIQHYESMKGQAFNVGLSDSNLSKMELCEKIREDIPDFHIFESELAKDPDKRDYIVSNQKLESTGWKSEFGLKDGIKELIKSYSCLSVNRFRNLG